MYYKHKLILFPRTESSLINKYYSQKMRKLSVLKYFLANRLPISVGALKAISQFDNTVPQIKCLLSEFINDEAIF